MSAGNDGLKDLSLLDLFLMEVETQSMTLNAGLLRLESSTSDPEILEALMRASHSLKGAARIVQLDSVVELAHVMEDCFSAAQQHSLTLDAETIDLLLRGVDLFSRLHNVPSDQIPAWLETNQELYLNHTQQLRSLYLGVMKPINTASPSQPPHSNTPPVVIETTPPTHERAGDEFARSQRVVRISAEILDRVVSLAGESMVQARWLRPYAQSLLQLRRRQWDLERGIDQLRSMIDAEGRSSVYEGVLDILQRDAALNREMITERYNEFEEYARRSSNLANRLYREALASRMRPFAEGVSGFPRMIRDLARQLGKKIRLAIIGLNTDVDRDILDRLEAPLNHLLRNAASHGIESPEERIAQGKPEEGVITLEAAHLSGMLSITVRDDGRGIDPETIRTRVVERGLAMPDVAERLNHKELLDFLFLPRFTTVDQISEIAGRGVGLDIVQTMAQEVHGVVRVASTPGKGFCVHMQLPITLSVVRALLIDVAGETLSIPLSRIARVVRIPREEIRLIENKPYATIDGRNIGLITAHQVLEYPASHVMHAEVCAVVLEDGADLYGLVVDGFRGEQRLVVRPLHPRLGKIPDVSAAGILRDGSAVLILDSDDLLHSIETILEKGRLSKFDANAENQAKARTKRILVVDDSLTVREVQRRLLQHYGYEVDVAVDGIDGWNALQKQRYDLVISDVDMPRMNGFELVRRIKGEPSLRGLPVMIVSYKDREADRKKGLESGATFYLTKTSFHDESLVNAVFELIGEASA